MSQSIATATVSKSEKPSKPYAGYPLFPHASGRWAKKIRQRFHYFGTWRDDPKGERALELYLEQRDDLHAGRTPRPTQPDQLTLADLCNQFLTMKQRRMEAGEITARTFYDCHGVCEMLIEAFGRGQSVTGLRASDFERLGHAMERKGWGPRTIYNQITRVRTVFKYAFDEGCASPTGSPAPPSRSSP